jgi:hypothetical protein
MLDLAAHEELSPPEFVAPNKRRSPLVAMLLSMVFPGLGHLYIGLRRHAAWLIGTELLALAGTAYSSGVIHGQFILMLPTLTCFAIMDSYYSAREWNAGATSLLAGANPRIAALLNFLTKGFGYFYLGDKAKGFVVFLALWATQTFHLLHPNIWLLILLISTQILISADGYRIARQRLLAKHPEIDKSEDGGKGAVDLANPRGLQPAVASAIFLTFGVVLLLGYASLQALNGRYATTLGSLERDPSGLVYRNPVENIELTVPTDWDDSHPTHTLIELSGDGCSIIVYKKLFIPTIGTDIKANEKGFLGDIPTQASSLLSRFSTVVPLIASRHPSRIVQA